MTNTDLLEELIRQSGYKKGYIAKELKLSRYSLGKKISNVTEFKASEIADMCKVLKITDKKVKEQLFFA